LPFQLKNDNHIEVDGTVFKVLEFQHVNPGKGAAFVRTRCRGRRCRGERKRSERQCPHKGRSQPAPLHDESPPERALGLLTTSFG
jgi:hypothetical protein